MRGHGDRTTITPSRFDSSGILAKRPRWHRLLQRSVGCRSLVSAIRVKAGTEFGDHRAGPGEAPEDYRPLLQRCPIAQRLYHQCGPGTTGATGRMRNTRILIPRGLLSCACYPPDRRSSARACCSRSRSPPSAHERSRRRHRPQRLRLHRPEGRAARPSPAPTSAVFPMRPREWCRRASSTCRQRIQSCRLQRPRRSSRRVR